MTDTEFIYHLLGVLADVSVDVTRATLTEAIHQHLKTRAPTKFPQYPGPRPTHDR